MAKAKPIAVLFADSHLQESAWSESPVAGDAKYSLEQIVSWAVDRRVAAVVGAGDLLDKQRNRAGPVGHFFGQLDRLEAARIPFYYVEGQHDMDTPPWLSGHSWAVHLHGRLVGVGDFRLYGLNFLPAGRLQEALDAVPAGADTLVCHQTWADWMGDVTNPQGAFADVPRVRRVFSGDFHRCVIETAAGRDGQEMTVCSPGSTCMQDVAEPPDKYFIVLREDGTFGKVQLRTRPFVNWPVLNSPEDLEDFVAEFEGVLAGVLAGCEAAALPGHLRTPIVRVTYSGRLHDCVRRVEKVVKRRAHLFWKELPAGERRAGAKAAPAGGAPLTLAAALACELDPKKEAEAFALAQALLTAAEAGGDVRRVVADWREEFMKGEGD